MAGRIVTYRSRIPCPQEQLFEWYTRGAAFRRLNPPWKPVRLPHGHPGVFDGAEVTIRLRPGAIPVDLKVRHQNVHPPDSFEFVQVSGPFSRWRHTHRMLPHEEGWSILEDEIEFEFKGGAIVDRTAAQAVIRELDRVFAYRHRITAHDLTVAQRYDPRSMRVGMTGASGLLGSNLTAFLEAAGHTVIPFVRRTSPAGPGRIAWDPGGSFFEGDKAEGLDVVIHLAGENIFNVWTAERKRKIKRSRIEGTRNLVRGLTGLDRPPKVLISASAVGYYGDRGSEELPENAAPGEGFFASFVPDWESEAMSAAEHGIRVVVTRNAPVLTPRGGPLWTMKLPFLLGLGATVGKGEEFFPWIGMEDYLGALYHCLMTEALSGPVNFVSPDSVTQRTLSKTFAAVLNRPAFLRIPADLARMAPGNMADEMVLVSARAVPAALENSGFQFMFSDLRFVLEHLFGKTDQLLPMQEGPIENVEMPA